MNDLSLDMLVISDLHYIGQADHVCPIAERKCSLGLSLLRGALARLREEGIELGLVILLGDLIDNGLANGADQDLMAIAQATRHTGLPFLAVPGNHDGDFERLVRIFNCAPGLHEIGGYGFLVLHDQVDKGDVTTRSRAGLAFPEQVARERPDLPLVALQHNPLHPPIEADYPYLLTNAREVLQGYNQAGTQRPLSSGTTRPPDRGRGLLHLARRLRGAVPLGPRPPPRPRGPSAGGNAGGRRQARP
jgi:hypothetical protein